MTVFNKNQQIKKSISDQYFSDQITPGENFLKNPKKALNKLSSIHKRALWHILWLKGKKSIYFSQDWLARKVGCSRKTINETVGELCKMGLIAKFFRMMETCLYRISEFITKPNEIWRAALLSISVFYAFNLLSYPQKQVCTGRVTQYVKIFISNGVSYNKVNTFNGSIGKYLSRARTKMNENRQLSTFEDNLPECIRTQRLIALTKEQQALLASFPEGALVFALSRVQKNDNFRLLRYLANKWCIERNITPSYRLYNELVEKYDIPMYTSTQKTPKREESVAPKSNEEGPRYKAFKFDSNIQAVYAKNDWLRKYRVQKDLEFLGSSPLETSEEKELRLKNIVEF